ncbi:LuxR C-terminal-related transcriptional regulator [Kineosporia succinea]|uniref:DNA-binding NarL/FixJ family response regulator n=1 Tax=Kineosporia succinea TaxID=84632 RepID=A0ABT9P903_9ACTN|nr:response regulator transcription factor [Kineosporia succinea]MDP9828645.1 DNA-binding NarL/FixJ family response regulator [Kineosporia succinea]
MSDFDAAAWLSTGSVPTTAPGNRITVLLVDDNPTIRATLRPLLEADPQISVVAEAGNGAAGLSEARRLRPRVTVLDHQMPVADGLSVIEDIARHSNVLVLTSNDSQDIIAPMLRGGARGYLVYGRFDPADLVAAVRAVADGQGWLIPAAASVATGAVRDAYARERAAGARHGNLRRTRRAFGLSEREIEVLELVGDGLSNAAIATQLKLSEKTVKNHLSKVFGKLDVTSRTEALARWHGWR